MPELPLTISFPSTSIPTNGRRLNTLTMPQSQEEAIPSSQLEERFTVTVVGTLRVSTTTLSSLTLTLLNGTTQIFTTTFQDGIIAPLWLRLFHHGNISFSVVRLVTSQKEVQETSVTALTVLATSILRPCIGLLCNQRMLMLQTRVCCLLLENTLLWPMIIKTPDS